MPLRPMVAAGMAKKPAARPPDAASFVAGLNAAAAGAYGPDWENRGRSHLAEAALLLAALWPSGSAPAVAGHAVQHVGLSGGGQPSQNYQPTQNYQPSQNAQPSQPYQGQPSQVSPESEHARHLEHVRHLEHLKHLRRLRLALTGVGAVVVAAAVALVVIAPWKSPPPVLKPTGLVLDASTTSSVAIRWAGPATGPEPTVYKILRNGHVIAQVPGTTTYFRETGLPPATSFRFQVFAIRGNKKSPRSSVLTVTTVTPPVSAGVLDRDVVRPLEGPLRLQQRERKSRTDLERLLELHSGLPGRLVQRDRKRESERGHVRRRLPGPREYRVQREHDGGRVL